MIINRTEKQLLAEPGEKVYIDLEALIMQNIVRHVKNYDQLIASDTWLLQKLAEIGKLDKENKEIISKAAGLSQTAVKRMLEETVAIVMERVEPGLTELERQGIIEGAQPAKKSKNVKEALKAVRRQALSDLNLCNTTMLYMAREAYTKLVQDTAKRAEEIANKQEFLDVLGEHANADIIGAESRQQAIRDVIKDFNAKGIPAFVDKRGREWTPEAYVSMTLRTTAGNTATESLMARMDDRGLSLIQVSSHPGARPKCAKDQGKIFDRNNGRGITTDLHGKEIPYYPWRESSYGEPDGLFGINCGHRGTPFIPGISRERYKPTEDTEKNDKLYRKMQIQREMEREIRKQKRLCRLYEESGEQEAFEEAAVKLKGKEAKIEQYLKKNKELFRRRDREQVIGFDKRVSAESVGKAQKHYKEWAKSIGAESGPKKLAGYYDLKYNDNKESRLYKGYIEAVNKGRISPLVGYDKFKEIAGEIEERFVGMKTSDGLEVKGYTAHFVDRVIGQQSPDSPPRKKTRNGVGYADIEDALKNPKIIGPIVKNNAGNRSKIYYGKNAAVSYNPDTQELVQVQPKRTK